MAEEKTLAQLLAEARKVAEAQLQPIIGPCVAEVHGGLDISIQSNQGPLIIEKV